jgi:hypothetical protein
MTTAGSMLFFPYHCQVFLVESLLKPPIGAKMGRDSGIDIRIGQQVHFGRFTSFLHFGPVWSYHEENYSLPWCTHGPEAWPSRTETACESQSLI